MTQADPTAMAMVLRALATAANALRLYPATSHLPAEAVERFVGVAQENSKALGHLRFVIEPSHFTWGEHAIGRENAQIETLAQALYSHQAGQLLIAPGVTQEETVAFLQEIERDQAELKDAGGITRALVARGVSHVAVVEMSVRASDEEGLKGVDLLAAPLDEIGREVAAATERWASAARSGEAEDEALSAVGDLPEATQQIAASRITEALLRLDESTRTRVLAEARSRDASGRPMEGMLKIVGQMSPAALSRLLTLAVQGTAEDPKSVLPELDLPPETFDLLTKMLSPSPQSEAQRGVPPAADHKGMADIVAAPDEASAEDLERQIAASSPRLAAGRGLATACLVAAGEPDPDRVLAVGEALAPALRTGAFGRVDDALGLLEEIASRPGLADAVRTAQQQLADPELLADACATAGEDVPPDTLARIVLAAGEVGFDVFVTCWTGSDAAKRARLEPILPRLGERLVSSVGKLARGSDTPRARDAVSLLGVIGGNRAIPTLAQLTQHADLSMRLAALAALSEIGGAGAGSTLASALSGGDEQTRIAAAQEIARGMVREAIPGLIEALEQYHLVEREADFKREVINSMVALGAQDALPALKRAASRKWAFGAGNNVVRATAREAITRLAP